VRINLLNRNVLKASALICAALILLGIVLHYLVGFSPVGIFLFSLLSFAVVFLSVRTFLRQFILTELRKVYDSSLFQNEPYLKKESNVLDFELFLSKVKSFAESKHREIEQLHNRDDFRTEFMGDVSHELKTPLFTAQGYLLTVLEGNMDDKKLEKKYLKRTEKSLNRLNSIVKDLDTLAKLETGMKLNQEPFNLVQSVREVMDMLEYSAEKKGILLEFKEPYDYPVMVQADKEKIEQVLTNLIQNSINYGKLGGRTTVSFSSHSLYRQLIEIQDDGMGIDPESLPRLFERFYRVDKSRSREHGGSGLGLAIVKHILEAHDQEVFVQSASNQGSTFSFTLNKAG
jgi:two-component system phosphate regulon sensor histidine kinase PhoR